MPGIPSKDASFVRGTPRNYALTLNLVTVVVICLIPDNITQKIDMNTLTHRECAYHKFPITCCSEIAAIGRGTTIKGRAIPDDKIPMLLFGNTKSTLKGLGLGKSGKISSISLAGYLRKMSPETFEIFEELFDDSEK